MSIPRSLFNRSKRLIKFIFAPRNSGFLLIISILCWLLTIQFYREELPPAYDPTHGIDIYHLVLEYGPIIVGGLGAIVTQLTKTHLKHFPQDRIYIWFPWTEAAQQAFKNECQLHRNNMKFHILEHFTNQTTLAQIHSCQMIKYNVTVLFTDLPEHKLYRSILDRINTTDLIYYKSFDNMHYFSQIVAKAMEMRILDMSKQLRIRKSILHLHTGRFGLVASQLRHPNKDPYTAKILKKYLKIVTTWHDYTYEYEIAQGNVYSTNALKQLVHEPELYVNQESKIIISLVTAAHSDATICVSTKMRDGLANGFIKVIEIHDRWWPFVKQRPFLAVTNNLALNEMRHNPWKSLIKILSNGRLFYQGQECDSFVEVKQAAKKRAVDIFKAQLGRFDLLNKTWVIFTGRFDEAKGSVLLGPASDVIKALPNACLIITSSTPLANFELRNKLSSNEVILLDDYKFETDYGILFRLAADIAFIPSRQEAFGLVGVESFLYGQMLVNSRAVGLLEYSIDYKQKLNETTKEVQSNWLKSVRNCIPLWMNENTPSYCYNLTRQSPFSFNSVQFNVHISETTNLQQDEIQVTNALNKAIRLYQSMNAIQREQFLWHQVSNAGPFVMERPGGMVDQYRDIYLQLT